MLVNELVNESIVTGLSELKSMTNMRKTTVPVKWITKQCVKIELLLLVGSRNLSDELSVILAIQCYSCVTGEDTLNGNQLIVTQKFLENLP